jgi:hypothetical protein
VGTSLPSLAATSNCEPFFDSNGLAPRRQTTLKGEMRRGASTRKAAESQDRSMPPGDRLEKRLFTRKWLVPALVAMLEKAGQTLANRAVRLKIKTL